MIVVPKIKEVDILLVEKATSWESCGEENENGSTLCTCLGATKKCGSSGHFGNNYRIVRALQCFVRGKEVVGWVKRIESSITDIMHFRLKQHLSIPSSAYGIWYFLERYMDLCIFPTFLAINYI